MAPLQRAREGLARLRQAAAAAGEDGALREESKLLADEAVVLLEALRWKVGAWPCTGLRSSVAMTQGLAAAQSQG